MKLFTLTSILLSSLTLVSGHARLRQPVPLGFGSTPQLSGNAYNNPLKYDGSDFPCKGLIGVADMTPQAKWTAGAKGMFEIWPNEGNGGEGNMAAHSGGSCQISLSYDGGKSFKVLQSYEGGCPRDVPLNSNIAGPNQTFTFDIPKEAKAGNALAAWTWLARTGNRGEFYMNCASVTIEGTGTSTLDTLPDMWVGELVKGDITASMCRSTQNFYFLYPNPGDNVSKATDGEFKGPSGPGPDGTFNACKAPGGTNSPPQNPTSSPRNPTPTPYPTQPAPTQPAPTPYPTPDQPTPDQPTPTPNRPTQRPGKPTPTMTYPSPSGTQPPTLAPFDVFQANVQGYIYECRLNSAKA